MVNATASWNLPAPAERVWELMGDFNGLPKLHPEVVASELEDEGAIRRLTLADGAQFVERLVERDEAARSLAYEIVGAVGMELPFTRYVGVYRVRDDVPGESCVFELIGDYEGEGFTEADAVEDMHAFYDVCMAGVSKALGL